MYNLNFDATSNIQHTYFHTSAAEQIHMPMNNYQGPTNIVSSANLYETSCANDFNTFQQGVSYAYSSATNLEYLTQSMPMNEKIGHADFRYPAKYSQPLYARVEDACRNSAPYTNANTYTSVPNVSNIYSRTNENSARSHSSPQINFSCVSSHASSHSFGTTHSSLSKVHACDFAQKTAPNSVSTILQKPNTLWDAEHAELKNDVIKRFNKDKKFEDKLSKFAEHTNKIV